MTKSKKAREADVEPNAQLENEATNRMSKGYARLVIPENDGSFRGEIIELPGCFAVGRSASEALNSLEGSAESWMMAALAAGQPIPDPIDTGAEFSGKLMLRLPKSLHKKASWYSSLENVSLNQFIVYCISECIGERRVSRNVTIQYIKLDTTHKASIYVTMANTTPYLLPAISQNALVSHNADS